jgi:hypothetical protein
MDLATTLGERVGLDAAILRRMVAGVKLLDEPSVSLPHMFGISRCEEVGVERPGGVQVVAVEVKPEIPKGRISLRVV